MKWSKLGLKGLLGILTFIVAYLAANPATITNLIPANITNMTIGSLVAGLLVSLANWLKHKNDSK